MPSRNPMAMAKTASQKNLKRHVRKVCFIVWSFDKANYKKQGKTALLDSG